MKLSLKRGLCHKKDLTTSNNTFHNTSCNTSYNTYFNTSHNTSNNQVEIRCEKQNSREAAKSESAFFERQQSSSFHQDGNTLEANMNSKTTTHSSKSTTGGISPSPNKTLGLKRRQSDEKFVTTSQNQSKIRFQEQVREEATNIDSFDIQRSSAGCSGVQTEVSAKLNRFKSTQFSKYTSPQPSLQTDGNIGTMVDKTQKQETKSNKSNFESFGHQVANSLTQMSAEQQVVAVSLITDLLFVGKLGKLSW